MSNIIYQTSLYPELIYLKDNFEAAVQIYFRKGMQFSCNYENSTKKRTVKIRLNSQFHIELLKLIEESELKRQNPNKGVKQVLNKTVMFNNIMSCLIGIKRYN